MRRRAYEADLRYICRRAYGADLRLHAGISTKAWCGWRLGGGGGGGVGVVSCKVCRVMRVSDAPAPIGYYYEPGQSERQRYKRKVYKVYACVGYSYARLVAY